jgi:type III secretion system YscJ/HrcJ family lipoprotein
MRATALVAVALLTACGGNVAIVHQLEELEANEILVVLDAKDITGTKVVQEGRVVTWSVEVQEIDVKDAMRLLVANRLPKARSEGYKTVYPPGGGGLIPTKSEEKAKFLMATQGEIERKLKSMPGIVQAHVSVVQPDRDVVRDLDTPPPASTASVAIVYNPIDERGTAAVKEDEVQKLVSSSVEDLKPANVIVVMKRNTPMNLVPDFANKGGVDAPVAAATQFGFRFADKNSARKMALYGIVALLVGVVCLAVGVGGIVQAMGLRRRLVRAEAELTSQRKARRETQTGLQDQR